MSGVFIATPTTRAFETGFVASLVGTNLADSMWCPLEGQSVQVARNLLVQRFLHSPYKYLLFIDSDATWHPDTIQRLVDRDVPMVCPVFFKRDLAPTPTIGMKTGHIEDGFTLYDFAPTVRHIVTHPHFADPDTVPGENEFLLDPRADDLLLVDGCGMHFTMVRRDVLEAITEAKQPYFDSRDVTAGEDFAFCQRVRALDFPIYVDRSVYVGHILGPGISIGVRDFLRAYKLGAYDTDQIWRIP